MVTPMKITVIHGQSHKGSTYHMTEQYLHYLADTNSQIDEFFMPSDGPKYCVGCYKCFNENEALCPHADKVQKIVQSMETADLILVDSPTYCLSMTGQLKTFFDHLGYMWLPHRPNASMFHKVAVVISSTAGAGAGQVNKALAQQLFWMGVPKVFKYKKAVNALNWETVPDKIKTSIERDIKKSAKKVKAKLGHTRVPLRLKFLFNIMRLVQKSNKWNPTDQIHWRENGWLGKERPWK